MGPCGLWGCSEPLALPICMSATAEQLKCARATSASQWREDLILLPLLLQAAHSVAARGTFVELGALNGHTYSNTLMLERCFNFTGLLIEANPHNFARLNSSRRAAAKVHWAFRASLRS